MFKLPKKATKYARSVRQAADLARDEKDWELARSLYQVYLSQPQTEHDAAIWVQLGHACKEGGRFDDALLAYKRSTALLPGKADTHLQIGHVLKLMNRMDASYAAYKEALRLEPANADVAKEIKHLAPSQDGLVGSTRESDDHVSAIEQRQDSRDWLNEADAARDARDWANAAKFYDMYLQRRRSVNDAAIWVQFGHALKEGGDRVRALAAYKHAVELAPDLADAHLQYGHILKVIGLENEALECYLEAIDLDPTLKNAHQEIEGLCYKRPNFVDTLYNWPANEVRSPYREMG